MLWLFLLAAYLYVYTLSENRESPKTMAITILKAENHRRMPWKNGAGVTVEIAVHPQGASVDDFDWRVSMATVASDGPFSRFPGIDRTLSVLQGDGIVLTVDGRETRLTRDSASFAFAADAEASARLIAAPITDLNVMTRRGRFAHRVERLVLDGARTLDPVPSLVFCAEGAATVGTQQLHTGDCAVVSQPGPLPIEGRGTFFSVEIHTLRQG